MKFIGIYNVPGLFTFTGLILSLMAIFLSHNSLLKYAIICLIYAGIFDLFDGVVARKMKLSDEESLFGIQIDTIVDIVSFGIVPIIISLNLKLNSPVDYIIFIFYGCSAAMRLAYFNITGTHESGENVYYTGLPVTFAALIFPIIFISIIYTSPETYINIIRLSFVVISFLFILNIPIPKPRGKFYIFFPLLALATTIFWLFV